MILPRLLHHSQVILSQPFDVLVEDLPIRANVPIQLLSLELDIPQRVSRLPQPVRQTLAFH